MGFHCTAAIGMDLATGSGRDVLLLPKSAPLCGTQLVLPNHNIAVRLPAKRGFRPSSSLVIDDGIPFQFLLGPFAGRGFLVSGTFP